MSTDERKEWLASLMPGDEVVVCHGWDETFIKTAKVERITSSGHIVAGNREYDPEHGVDTGRTKGVPRMLCPLPGSIKGTDERKALATRFRAVDWESLPIEKLRAIATHLDRKESSKNHLLAGAVKVGQLREPYSLPAGRVHPDRVRVVGHVGDRFRISDAKAATRVFSAKTIEKRWPVVVSGGPTADYPKEREHSG